MTGHVVMQPCASPHRTLRLVTDVDLLLAHTVASVRLNQRMIVFEPPEWLARPASSARRRTRRPEGPSRRRAGCRRG